MWEVIPTVARTMNFRVAARGNYAGGSCNSYQDVTLTTSNTAGPFVVTYPTSTGISWSQGSSQTITWDVANTNGAPVNASLVNILLSLDGGNTYSQVLASGVTNNGSYTVTVPNYPTTKARIMIQASDERFFNISSNDFTIS